MVTWSTGSVAAQCHNFVEDIPTVLSGTALIDLARRKMEFVKKYTGDTNVSESNISDVYQGPILNLTIAETFKTMNAIGADVNSISLGDLSISKGGESNLIAAGNAFESMAMTELKAVGRRSASYKSLGE